jgi:hypothetical protein
MSDTMINAIVIGIIFMGMLLVFRVAKTIFSTLITLVICVLGWVAFTSLMPNEAERVEESLVGLVSDVDGQTLDLPEPPLDASEAGVILERVVDIAQEQIDAMARESNPDSVEATKQNPSEYPDTQKQSESVGAEAVQGSSNSHLANMGGSQQIKRSQVDSDGATIQNSLIFYVLLFVLTGAVFTTAWLVFGAQSRHVRFRISRGEHDHSPWYSPQVNFFSRGSRGPARWLWWQRAAEVNLTELLQDSGSHMKFMYNSSGIDASDRERLFYATTTYSQINDVSTSFLINGRTDNAELHIQKVDPAKSPISRFGLEIVFLTAFLPLVFYLAWQLQEYLM